MFQKQTICCAICGKKFDTDFRYCGGFCCSTECRDEYEWRKTLYIMGEKYHPKGIDKLHKT